MPNKVCSGLCIGGPLDGKRLDHYCDIYSVPLYKDSVLDFNPDKIEAATNVEVFDYVHFHLDTNLAFWIPKSVEKGGYFENKLYHWPMQFIVKRLAANYRPEGF